MYSFPSLFILLAIVTGTMATIGPPNITSISPRTAMRDRVSVFTLYGIHFQDTVSISIGGESCMVPNGIIPSTPEISPCLLQMSRQEACDFEAERMSFLEVGDLFPCDLLNNCVYWISSTTSCPSTSTSICQTHRCFYPDHSQCYGFLDTPDFSWCADGKACLDGQCVDARGDSCPSTITCTLSGDNGLPPGLYNVSITAFNGTFILEEAVRFLPEAGDIVVSSPVFYDAIGTDAIVSPGTPISVTIAQFDDGTILNYTIVMEAKNVSFPNNSPFSVLDIDGNSFEEVVVVFWITYADFDLETAHASSINWTLTYAAQPIIYSLCPSAILSFIDNTIVVQGEHYVDTPYFECRVDNVLVPHTIINERTAHCIVNANSTGGTILSLQITNDGFTEAGAPGTVTVTGACELLKPNSVAVEDECLCVAGFEDTKVACVPCPDGTYQPQIGQQLCVPCDSTESTGGITGSTSVEACRCKDGRFRAEAGDTSCALCAEGMICENGKIIVQEGYWRQSETDLFVVECPAGNMGCAGGEGAGNAVCKEGYEGPVCAVCSEGYGKIGSVCVKCQEAGVNIFVMIILIILGLGMAIVLIRSTADRSHGAADFSTTIKITVSYLQVLYYVGQLSADWSYLSDQFFASTVAASMSPSFLSMQCAMPMSFYNRITLTMLMPIFMSVIFAFPFLVIFCARRTLQTSSLFVLREYGASVLIVLYIIHPPIALDVLGSLRCEEVQGTGTRYMRDDMRVDCESDSYKVYRVIAILYIALYIVGFAVFIGWRIKVNRDALNAALSIRSLDEPIYIYFVRGYSKRQYLWEGAVLARKLGIVMCNAFLSSGLQLVWGLIIIGLSLGFTVLKQPYERVFANRLDTYALIALVVTVVLGFHSLFTESETDLTIFALLIIFNGFVMFALLAATISKMKGPMQDFLKKVADYIGINDKAALKDVEMHDRRSVTSDSFSSSRPTKFSSVHAAALPDTPRPADDERRLERSRPAPLDVGVFLFEDVPL